MKKAGFGLKGEIHPKDRSGYFGAAIPEIGLFTQAKSLKTLERSIAEAFSDLTESKIEVEVTLLDEGFLLSSSKVQEFFALILRAFRGDRSVRDVMPLAKERSPRGVARYEEIGGTTPSLAKAVQLLQALDPTEDEHVLAWVPKRKSG